MAAERKISDEDLARLRHLHADGWSLEDLAAAFGVTSQHVGRLVRGEQRPVIASHPWVTDPSCQLANDPEALKSLKSGVAAAVEAFLTDISLGAGDEVLAATARALAAKLDACGASDSASAAQAVPRLSSELVEVLDRLRLGEARPPDDLDRLLARRRTRRSGFSVNGKAGT